VRERPVGAVFVGRDGDVAELLAAFSEAEAGHGGIILIGGEPGVGKTRLADEVAAEVRRRQGRVLWGRAWQDAGAPPYWPWTQALRTFLRAADSDEARRALGRGAADVAAILPEIRDMIPALPPTPSADPESARFRLFDSTAHFLAGASAGRPMLLVLDDIHAADTASLLLLRFVAGAIAGARVLIVSTYRTLELTPDHPLTGALAELVREPTVRRRHLRGLPRDGIADFVEATTGSRPGPHLVSELLRRTNGNPLFLGEAFRLSGAEAADGGLRGIEAASIGIPVAIRDVIARRIGHLDDEVARILRDASVIGPEFEAALLGDIEAQDGLELEHRLEPAVRAGLLVDTAAPGRFRFAHDLIRQTLYEELGPGARTLLHRDIAAALEARGDEASHLAELAYHAYEGAAAGGIERAVRYSQVAGDAAAASLAYEEAATFYRMALAILEHGHDEERCELLLALGDAETRAGHLGSAQAVFLEAAAIARRDGDGVRLARASLGYGGRFVWARAGGDANIIPLLRAALEMLGGTDHPLEVRLMARLACAYRSSMDQRAECDALTSRALAIARRLGDPATLSYALVGRFWATYWPEDPERRLEVARELTAVAEGAGDAERAIDGHWALHVSAMDLGRTGEARAELDILGRAAVELRQPSHVWALRTYEAVVALLEGTYERAEELIEAELRPHGINSIRDDESTSRMHRFLLRSEQGRAAEEEAAIRRAAAEFPWYPYHRSTLAVLLAGAGRLDESREVFAELARDDFAAVYRDCEWFLGICLASVACAALGDERAAAVLYGQLRPFAGRHAIAHAEGSLGCTDRYLGLLAAVMGHVDEAVEHLEAAIRLNERLGSRPWAAHSRVDLARVLRQRGARTDVARASVLEAEAAATAADLGMTALLGRLEGAASTPQEGIVAHPGAPTRATFRREGEYWTVRFGHDAFRLRDSKGVRYLARLLAAPGHEFHALDLAGPVGDGSTAPDRGDAGEVLDAAARRAYRERLADLEDEIVEAEAWHDVERAARLREERAMLVSELSAAMGIGGRARRAGSSAERARMSVGKAIRGTLQRIGACSRPLGDHLAVSVHTGTLCSYRPDPGLDVSWEL
jgi:tetratricopeptide (TPR) repeat protein